MDSVRTLFWAYVLLLAQSIVSGNTGGSAQRPHIIIIMADDMGIDDVGFHGSNQIPTPNIDALGYDGIILNRHYTAPMCTPSRAALMTGKHPINNGMQHYVIDADEPWGLGLDQKIMPEYFKEAGYRTHLVGKWHLGFYAKQYTPTMRGFDTHTGYLGPFIDYWNCTLEMTSMGNNYVGYDMRQDLEVDRNVSGKYVTDHFTDTASSIILKHKPDEPLFLMVNHLAPHAANEYDPLQAPEEVVQRFKNISNSGRRIYAAMVSKVDESVGQIFKSLQSKNMLQNSIILFMSDNGAPAVGLHTNHGSNHPLRGQKNSPWEGATRNAAVIWSPLLRERQRVSNQFIYIADWLPTLASAANMRFPRNDSEIDGIDQWEALSYDTGSPRRVVLNNIDEIYGYSSCLKDGFKYINGTTLDGAYDSWYKQPNNNDTYISDEEYIGMVMETEIVQSSSEMLSKDLVRHLRRHARINCGDIPVESNECNPLIRPCLFDVVNDPCELNDVSHKYPEKLRDLAATIELYRSKAVKPRNKPLDPAADPANFGGIWTWWRNDNDLFYYELATPSPTQSSLPEDVQLIVIIIILVVGILFVIVALIYLSNKNLLRMCRSNKMGSTTESAESQACSQSSMPECDISREGKFSGVLGPTSTPKGSSPKVYRISDNSLNVP